MNKKVVIILIVLAALAACCCIAIVASGAAYSLFKDADVIGSTDPELFFPETEEVNPDVTAEPLITMPPAEPETLESADDMLSVLEETIIPISNYYDLASRLHGKNDISITMPAPLAEPVKGDKQEFWVSNTDSHESFEINARLAYVTDHLYFWVEEGVDVDAGELKSLGDTFEKDIYPTDREFFGSEWTPGVDNDEHLYIVFAGGLGDSLAGYYSSADEYNPEVHEYSNAHEMFLLNSDTVDLGDEFTYGVLAHEFQHMIHWYRDLNEETWLNEGFSELAALLNGYDVGGFDVSYTMDTDLQLTDWYSGVGDNSPHYGASFLFVTYFLDRFGEDATKAVVASQNNGMPSITEVLADMNETDPATGQPISADDVFSDWVVTNYLNNETVGDGRFFYHNYDGLYNASATDEIDGCPTGSVDTTVYQYGADYIKINCSGKHTFTFTGQPLVGILNVNANSGEYAFWSNKGDESNMTLTREFDFSKVERPVSLIYNTWYDLEEDYDYTYLEVSEDGQNWSIIETPLGTDQDVSGNSFGWGYNGTTDGWVEETIDLSAYAGKKVQIRFEYITDAAVNGEGMLIDDISIPEIDYSEDFEAGDGGWEGAGFVRMNNVLPQTYRLNLIMTGGASIDVTPIELDADNNAVVELDIPSGKHAVITVSGTTPFTRQPAVYTYEVE